jgi:hypothetical protein
MVLARWHLSTVSEMLSCCDCDTVWCFPVARLVSSPVEMVLLREAKRKRESLKRTYARE